LCYFKEKAHVLVVRQWLRKGVLRVGRKTLGTEIIYKK